VAIAAVRRVSTEVPMAASCPFQLSAAAAVIQPKWRATGMRQAKRPHNVPVPAE
jgi:hypothetical protein